MNFGNKFSTLVALLYLMYLRFDKLLKFNGYACTCSLARSLSLSLRIQCK